MLVETSRVSLAWHPAEPQVSAATRKSPGFTNFTYSADSFSHIVKAFCGATPRLRKTGSRGCTCAFCFSARYSGEFAVVPLAMAAEEFPPWQSVHPSCTVFVGCMVASSIGEWQEMHPPDLRCASSFDCPRSPSAGSCRGAECPRSPKTRNAIAITAKQVADAPRGIALDFFGFAII